MASNEDYLDSLLKAAMETEQLEQDSAETIVEQQFNTEIENTAETTETIDAFSVSDDPNRSLTPEEIAAMFAELSGINETNESDESNEANETEISDTPESTVEMDLSNVLQDSNETEVPDLTKLLDMEHASDEEIG